MSTQEELIERATRRLEVDRELQLDIAQELRAHLDDLTDEFRRAGDSREKAIATAAKAIGDPDELSEKLWQANRKRMRLRGVLRWLARVALVPAAVIIVVGLAARLRESHRPDYSMDALASSMVGLTEDKKFILQGDPSAADRVDRAKSVSGRWPDDPVFYAHYVSVLCVEVPDTLYLRALLHFGG